MQTWKKTICLHKRGFIQKKIYQKKSAEILTKVNLQQNSVKCICRRKTRLPHIYRGNNYVFLSFVLLYKVKVKIYQIKRNKYNRIKRKIATSRQNSVPKLGKVLHKPCWHACTFFHLWYNVVFSTVYTILYIRK